ncbi:hypothetical protein CON65_16125 [Bacillus pseudomycoides]|uniref:ATP-grasp domain-containing protein n=1 Tax=Bacillus pseudomycoides TaxID=64104 RepID=A0AA91ZTK0_9BACI|nr:MULTISPECIES: ATP-grasp domain-containing protein [Bacillus]PEB56283.1 hypothetical protein COO03_01560 [Bacillus sp. AFS098217]PED81713.1 hypothetical protein CON65_16125 [Bacillus pseudomycoides]PEU09362.1 hypothetical protein CN525_24810 [Bacillus sp. AFS014408]PEU10641.1 hypothetical protein CN524_15970 [Bacillus sp. AFS019443]PFW64256.1 hypothetical protein COL20_05550 [Bacillus sp. AFS075034]
MNIILTSAGRRNYLVSYFQEILKVVDGKVYCTDASINAPIIQEADRTFIVPRVDDPTYFEVLLKICKDYDIKMIFSLNDLEIPLLAQQRERFLEVGVIPVVSQYEIIDLCRDKLKYNSMLEQCHLKTPKTYSTLEGVQEALVHNRVDFPLVIKPRWGTASIGVEFVYDEYELELAFHLLKRKLSRTILSKVSKNDFEHAILIQEKLEGTHYSVDIINDLNGKYVTTFVKEVLSMRAGDIDKAKTVINPQIVEIGRKIGQYLKHIGIINLDVICKDDEGYVIDMNARFGGGYAFTHEAGANIPQAFIDWAQDKTPNPDCFVTKENIKLGRYEEIADLNNVDRVDRKYV